jgi:hypothetical protein
MPLFPNIDLENYLRRVANLPETTEKDPARVVKTSSKKDDDKKEDDDTSKGGDNDGEKD